MGKQKQVPPIYSSIKINGKKAYEYARRGQEVKLEPRDIEIYNIELLELKKDEIIFKVNCSKGTYIRTLCEDIAKKLGTFAYMKDLRRTSIDKFTIEKSITLEELKSQTEKIKEKIINIEEIFTNKEKIDLNERKKDLFFNGVQLTFERPNDIYRIYYNNKFIGLGIIKNNLLKRDVVL